MARRSDSRSNSCHGSVSSAGLSKEGSRRNANPNSLRSKANRSTTSRRLHVPSSWLQLDRERSSVMQLKMGRRKNAHNKKSGAQSKMGSSSSKVVEKEAVPPPLSEIEIVKRSNDYDCDSDDSKHDAAKFWTGKKCFAVLFGLWILEWAVVYSLKHYGVVERGPFEDIQDAVIDGVNVAFPNLNESIDSLTHSMSQGADKKSVGQILSQKGAEANYPVVMIPGFVTSGLDLWKGKECTKGHFRQRLWATLSGARSFLVERDCWREHMMLDPYTGSDPEGIRVRASEGFAATDYIMMNYWVWGKLIENLAEVGYTPSNMVMLPYDWRVPFQILEERDAYLTNIKSKIETMHKTTGKKVVLATHSMGAMVVHHFFGWVATSERDGGGGGGKKWIDDHIHTYINIAGSHLGVPKAATALLSGEMSDTVFGGRMSTLLETFFARRLRRNLWSTWGSLWAMLPKGGNALWSPGADLCSVRSENDTMCLESGSATSPLIAMTDTMEEVCLSKNLTSAAKMNLNETLQSFADRDSHSTEELIDFLQQYGSGLGPNTVGTKFHSQFGKEKDKNKLWYDVTRSPLPSAPNMKIYCLYGTGLATERAYYYKRHLDDEPEIEDHIVNPVVVIDPINDEARNISYGIRYGDGDGSVPLISLGYVCADAWKRKDSGLNPSQIEVITREFQHKAEFTVEDPMRGGPSSADHVDILGNNRLMEDFLKIATNFDISSVAQDNITSNIKDLARDINDHPQGGLFAKKRRR